MRNRSALIQAIFYNNPDEYPPIINSTRLLAGAGYGVSILCRDNGQRWAVAYPPEARLTRMNAQGVGSWREYLSFVVRVMRQVDRRARVFIGHDMHGLLPARLLAWRYRRPLIYHCHDFAESGRPLPPGSRMVSLFERRFARTSKLVIVPDRERGALIARELHLPHLPLVVANAPLSMPPQDGSVLRQALAERGLRFSRILLRQGRVGNGHGLEVTIRSLPLWQGRDWGLIAMGLSESAYVTHLQDVAQSCGVAGQFVYLPPVGYDQIAAFTPGADVGHALYEPLHVNNVHITTASNKIMEYVAAGLPLMVSDRPALRQLVETYRCGICADERSPDSIAAAVNALLGDTDLARCLGHNGRRAFEDVFCYERQFASVLEALQRWNV
jgi:glycosyltransferase involved in cell wall biosynthesis